MPPILCDSSDANVTVGDFSLNEADIAIDPKLGRVPMRAGRLVPMPIGYGDMRRRTTPNSLMSSRISPLNWTGSGMSEVVRALRVERLRVSQAKSISASRCAGTEQSPESRSLFWQCATSWAASCRAQASLTSPGVRVCELAPTRLAI